MVISQHYYYTTDHGRKFEGTLEKLMHAIQMFDRKSALDVEGFEGSGADWMEEYKPYITVSFVSQFHGSRIRRVFIQGQVCPGIVIIIHVRSKNSTQMAFTKNDDMVEAIPRMEPTSRSTNGFCHGDWGVIITSPMARLRSHAR